MVAMATVAGLVTPALQDFCRAHSISRLRVFGSFARGEATPRSDLDLIADFSSPVSLFDIVSIERQLSELLGMRVDLLTEGGISPYIRERIASDIQVLYETR
jgi:predicted nucleotidyltransferase